jgi:hypothetical protein
VAIGPGVHIADERGNRVFYIALVEVFEGSLLAPLDIFSRGMSIIRERSILSIPKIRYEKSVDEFERLALIRLFESRQTDPFSVAVWELGH